jgi:hypothetical protein
MSTTLTTCANLGARPAGSLGDVVYQEDTKQIITYDGTTWQEYDSDGPAVNDADITALTPHLWLDPAHPSAFFTDSTKTTGVTVDGNYVGCFADRSGNGFDYVNDVTTGQPMLLTEAGVGGIPNLCYSSGDSLEFVGTAGSEIAADDLTIFFIWRLSPVGSAMILQGTSNGNEPRMRMNNSAGDFVHYQWLPFGPEQTSNYGGVTIATTPVAFADIAARHIYCLKTHSGDNRSYSYHNGGADIANAGGVPQPAPGSSGVYLEESETQKLFASLSGSPHWLFEHIVFNYSLTDAEVNTVNTYLGNKHGITVTDVS